MTTMKTDEPLLRLAGLRTDVARAGRTSHAVRGIDLDIRAGEAVGLVGESGCGKTMTAMSVLRLLPPGGRIVGGSIEFAGRDLVAATEDELSDIRGNQIGTIFQDPMTSLNPTMTVGDQIAEPLVRHLRLSWSVARRRAVEGLGLVGIPDPARRARSYPHQLSGGQRQRVMIAAAIACRPKLLIADEPTTALDVTVAGQVLDLIDELRRELNMAVLLVTHDLAVLAGRVDTVVAMYAGKIVERAATAEIIDRPRHPYLAALLASTPERANELGAAIPTIPGMPPDLTAPPPGCAFADRCARRTERCVQSEPAITDLRGHQVACFHPIESAPGSVQVTARVRRPAVPQPAPLLEVSGVVKRYRARGGVVVTAVDGVELSLDTGQTLGLVGESGCGKSTLGRIVVGLDRPDAGHVRIDGQDLGALRGRELRTRRKVAQLVFQDSYAALDPRMTVAAILAEPLRLQRTGNRRDRDAMVARLIDDVGLPADAAQRYPHEFSGGQRQRIGIARALALRPRLIVADEPVSALDVSVQAQILELLDGLQQEYSLSYLFISHDLEVVRYLADRIAVMHQGRIVESGPTGKVCGDPRHDYTKLLFESVPTIRSSRAGQGRGHDG